MTHPQASRHAIHDSTLSSSEYGRWIATAEFHLYGEMHERRQGRLEVGLSSPGLISRTFFPTFSNLSLAIIVFRTELAYLSSSNASITLEQLSGNGGSTPPVDFSSLEEPHTTANSA